MSAACLSGTLLPSGPFASEHFPASEGPLASPEDYRVGKVSRACSVGPGEAGICYKGDSEKLVFAKGDSQIGSGTSVNWEDLFLWKQESTVTESTFPSLLPGLLYRSDPFSCQYSQFQMLAQRL